MIELTGVTKRYPDGTVAVDDFSAQFQPHRTTVLLGSSGSGKTTILRMVNRMVDPTSGTITIDGTDIATRDPVRLRRSIGYVMQNGGLLPHRTVLDNIATVPLLNGTAKADAHARARELMGLVGLEEKLGRRYPSQLSGGQQQRVGVARGLAADPNAYGGLIVMALALHWATVNTNARLVPRLLAWPVTVVLLCNLLFSFSRSSWIAFAFVACVTPILRRRSWAHVIAPIGLATMLVLLFFRSYFAAEIWPLVARPSQVVGRFTILEKAVETFVAHPITGAGLGSYLREYGLQVHNTLFWMLAEMGVVGAVVFIGLALTFVIRGWRAYRMTDEENKGVVAGLLVAHLAMLGLYLGIEALYQRSWWVVMALLNASWALASVPSARASSFIDGLSTDTRMSVGS